MRNLSSASLLALVCITLPLAAQSGAPPRISQVMPLGGKVGTTVELTITGQDLEDVTGLHFSFPGAKVEAVTEAAPKTDPAKKGMAEKKPDNSKPKAVTVKKFKVDLPAAAPLGIHDIRVVGKSGVSNPRAFVLSDQTEVVEKETNNDVPDAQKIELNTTINGVIGAPTDVDYFTFTGKKGQRVVVACLTSSVDSRLPALVQIYSENGQYLGFSRNYWNNDAVVDCVLPSDGAFYVRLCSFTYTLGGPDYFYRLSVTTAPWIDAVFPHLIEPGKEAKVEVLGRNLDGGVLDPKITVDERPIEKTSATVKAPADAMAQQRLAYRGLVLPTSSGIDGFEFRVSNEAGASNTALVNFARAPVVVDRGDNDSAEKAQEIQLPCEIAGRIEKKNDRDFFRFSAKKGEVLSIEVFGDRLGSAVDMQFALTNEKGDTITTQDDVADQSPPHFLARTDDPARYRFTAPADGEYTLLVTSKEAQLVYGPRFIYTVRIGAEDPDFRIVAMPTATQTPESVIVGQSGHQAFSLYVQRLGGFTGDIVVQGEKLPAGLSVKPQVIAGNQKIGAVVVSANSEVPAYVGPIALTATATVGGKKLTREVRSATISWPVAQQNTATITRLDRELVVAVTDNAPYALAIKKDSIAVPQGDKITIPVVLAGDLKTNVQVTALVLPTGMALQPVTLNPGKETVITLDSKTTVLPGNYTVVLRGQTQPPQPNQQPKPGGPRNIIQSSPPIFVTIIPKQLAKINVPQNNPKVKAGGSVDVVIKLNRQFDYNGTFKVELDEKASKGIRADAVMLQGGDDDAKLTLHADDGLKAGATANITVRAVAMFNDTIPVVHEGKFTVSITK